MKLLRLTNLLTSSSMLNLRLRLTTNSLNVEKNKVTNNRLLT
ncbi:hypothetical protein GQ607_017110 [Colletotrichum asianum]|uniref:Uncharacterized protein n=1 Tax=Colletotrichum asianum TaxID=702518 RepID=A0A8H3ZJD0_9PEZI|nr:hypothetical protein GQ607_017110 [Colletotrichum asianum]